MSAQWFQSLSVKEQMDTLMRGVADVVSAEELEAKLRRSAKTGKPLRVKLGIDPTGFDLTLGHTVPLRKLKAFQSLGHQVVLIIGDYTAQVGDPTGRNEARPQLTHEQTLAHARHYVEQAARVIDIGRLEIRYNSEWLAPMNFADVIRLASTTTVARMLERDDFSKRYHEGRPISLHEFFYPLMQGYDSIAVQADVELGGTDQTFNLLMGRELQRDAGMEPQVCMTNPIVEGLDGVEKMSKSKGNYIAVADTPDEMYGKAMSIPDNLIVKYLTHFTEMPLSEIAALERAVAGGMNPRDAKMRLGRELVSLYHDAEDAAAAEERFKALFQKRGLPEDMPEFHPDPTLLEDGVAAAVRLLVAAGLAASASEAR
ncbi:MAG: tyrosine--tRNA ligase [Firmicutes bacterium]|nr:tyrosine--tRNA ligase [Bacillota bacterium]